MVETFITRFSLYRSLDIVLMNPPKIGKASRELVMTSNKPPKKDNRTKGYGTILSSERFQIGHEGLPTKNFRVHEDLENY